MTTVLITNDDGYTSSGYLPLVKEFSKKYSVIPIVPDSERSWIGKAITKKKKLRIKKMKRDGVDLFLLNGTPADCVQIGLFHVAEKHPDLVISGINIGLNIGTARMLSSGTIGAAIEASFEGIKAIATSLSIPVSTKDNIDFYSPINYSRFKQAAMITAKIADIVLHNSFDDGVDLFSVNIPFDATIDSKIVITTPFRDPYGSLFSKNGRRFIHHSPPVEYQNMLEGTDRKALHDEKISITPVNLTLISPSSVKNVEHIIKEAW